VRIGAASPAASDIPPQTQEGPAPPPQASAVPGPEPTPAVPPQADGSGPTPPGNGSRSDGIRSRLIEQRQRRRIPKEHIAELKAAVSLRGLIGQSVKLDRDGKGLCPFHHEKTPSFSPTSRIRRGKRRFSAGYALPSN
jgi:hypothetical protein